ncbi:D(1)-like dopamine receptor [Littorina saxatilis]|uniref:G-protein coupled receptors family 1 profile domain-containing protein n=1 Tax=Littorina saxatilis TaxID=31220 RepID=A0AAN9GLZ7_9CAEN
MAIDHDGVTTTFETLTNSTLHGNETELPRGRNKLAYVHFVIGTYILIANALVVICVVKFDYLKTRANIYIVSLACTDMLVGVMEWIVGLHNHQILAAWFDRTGTACVGMFSFAFFSVACSMFNMVLIALDRLLYINKPFYYTREVTSEKVKIAIGIVWVAALLWGTVPLYIHHYDGTKAHCTMQASIPTLYRAYLNVPVLFSGAVTTGVVYIIIAMTALAHKKAIYKSVPGSGPKGITEGADLTETAKAALTSMRSNMKTLKLFVIVFGLLVFCWFPYYIIEFTGEFNNISDAAYRASTALGFLNSGVNFLVYPLYNKKFRRALRAVVCPCLKQYTAHDMGSNTGMPIAKRGGGPPKPALGSFAPAPIPAARTSTLACPATIRGETSVDLEQAASNQQASGVAANQTATAVSENPTITLALEDEHVHPSEQQSSATNEATTTTGSPSHSELTETPGHADHAHGTTGSGVGIGETAAPAGSGSGH